MSKAGDLLNLEQFTEWALSQNRKEEVIDTSLLRYAIYARKSSEEAEKQVKSLPAQVEECLTFAKEVLHITIKEGDVIEENRSAKNSGTRPKYKALIDRIKKGEIDGILAWHPDRLSRNMLEAGELIDLLDHKVIKDLKFVSHTFTNDQSGKMLLSIVFAMAKQFSDKLQTDIRRGNKATLNDGTHIGWPPNGYIRDRNRFLRPDTENNNYNLIRQVFDMKLQGATATELALFLTSNSYFARDKDNNRREVSFSPNFFTTLFQKMVYTGFSKHGENVVNLMEAYGFEPMISVEEYQQINAKSFDREIKRESKRRTDTKKADLLSKEVFCAYCDEKMQAQTPKSHTGIKYYSWNCKSPKSVCPRKKRSTRAKVIVDFALDLLEQKPFSSKKAYESYQKEMLRLQKNATGNIQSQISSLSKSVGNLNAELEVINRNLAKEEDEEIKIAQKSALMSTKKKLRETQNALEEAYKQKEITKSSLPTYEQFISILEIQPERIRRVQSTTELNDILTKFFLNLTVSEEKVEKYTLSEPFSTLYSEKITRCGDGGN